jgi:SAM-dependent methyltransferase
MWTWFEDDTLWERLEGFLFSQFRSRESTVREAEQILGLIHPAQGATVPDLCCGPGRHALEFARRGFRVTGVDRTACYLATARAAATREGLTVECVQEDMRHFHRPAAFDLALNLFSSFGYFAEKAENLRVLRQLHSSLTPGGQVRRRKSSWPISAQGC